MRRSLSPSPYEAAVSRKLSGLPKTARSVSNARCSETEYSNVLGMFPSGAQPTQTGDTEKPVLPRGRLDEGSVTPFSAMDPASLSTPSTALRRALRRRFGVPERFVYALPQESLADALPDGVLHHGIVHVLGRDKSRLLRLLQQPPPPLRQRTDRRLGPGVP